MTGSDRKLSFTYHFWKSGRRHFRPLKTGIMSHGDTFSGGMEEVVRDGTRFMTNGDLEAVAAYLMKEDEFND